MAVNRKYLSEFKTRFSEVIKELENEYEVDISLGGMKYSGNCFQCKLIAANRVKSTNPQYVDIIIDPSLSRIEQIQILINNDISNVESISKRLGSNKSYISRLIKVNQIKKQ